jgi:para-nitrobenzyl esterase
MQLATSGCVAFFGVPYAAPPVGELRFRRTREIEPVTHIFDATRFGPASAQYFDRHEMRLEDIEPTKAAHGSATFVGDESSLTLNVWTPACDSGKRPVIIWIHGGANWLESSRLPVYHGERLAAHGDVVFVSLNYRLGVFGFLDVSVLGDPSYRASHTNGLHDQLAAIDWVRANIARFGGDPECITLVGESAGSMDISWLLASGRLQGRVRRIALMSGVAGVPGFGVLESGSFYSEPTGRRDAQSLLEGLAIRSIPDLQRLQTTELMTRFAALVPQEHTLFHWDSLFYPRIDGDFLKVDPYAYTRTGAARDIDMLLGATEYEMGLWLLWDDDLDQRGLRRTVDDFKFLPADARSDAIAAYSKILEHRRDGDRAMHFLGDAMFVMPTVQLAEEHAAQGARTWMYQFAWRVPTPRMGAAHAADVPFFLDTWETDAAALLIGRAKTDSDLSERKELARRMRDALLAFARHGDPNGAADTRAARWPAYTPSDRAVMVFDSSPHVRRDPWGERRAWWAHNVYPRMRL